MRCIPLGLPYHRACADIPGCIVVELLAEMADPRVSGNLIANVGPAEPGGVLNGVGHRKATVLVSSDLGSTSCYQRQNQTYNGNS